MTGSEPLGLAEVLSELMPIGGIRIEAAGPADPLSPGANAVPRRVPATRPMSP